MGSWTTFRIGTGFAKGRKRLFALLALLAAASMAGVFLSPAHADTNPQPLPLSQDFSDISLITRNDDWSGVPGVIGYRGDNLAAEGADPRTVLADGSGTPVNVTANKTNPSASNFGGITEFHETNQSPPKDLDPTIAFQGNVTSDAPHIVMTFNTTGQSNIRVSYLLRDIDRGSNDSVNPVALQYRVGNSGNYTNLPGGYVADATSGPNLDTLNTPVSAVLPAAADNKPFVQVRILTVNSVTSDEWIGVDALVAASANPAIDLNGGASGTGYSATFNEDGGSATIVNSSALTVTDADSPTLSSATATITNLQDGAAESLSADTTGTPITASYNSATGVLTLSGAGTPAQYQQVLRTVRYNNTSDTPGTTARSVNFVASDGTYSSNTATSTVTVNTANDAPTLSATATNPTYTENGTAVDVYSSVSASTVEGGQSIDRLTLAVSNVSGGASEILNIDGTDVALTNGNSVTTATNGMTVSVGVSGGTATVTITKSGGVSAAVAGNVIDGLTYRHAGDSPTAGDRVVTLTSIRDTGGTANGGSDTRTLNIASTVTVVPVNDPPVLTLPGNPVSYTENAAPAVIDSGATVTDADSANFDTGTLTVDFSSSGSVDDRLTISEGNNITVSGNAVSYNGTPFGTFTGGGGTTPLVITFDADATQGAVQALAGRVAFSNVSEDPSTAQRTVRFQVTDGDGGTSAAVTEAINITATNDAPTISDIANRTILEDADTGDIAFTIGDPDSGSLTVSGNSSDTTLVPGGDIVFGGSGANRTVKVTPAANRSGGPVTITITVSDGAQSATDTFQLTVTPVNDAPSFDLPASPNQTVNEDAGAQTVANFATSISAGPFETQNVTFEVTADNPSLFSAGPAIAPNGNLTYTPAANASGTATVTVRAKDDGGTANNGDEESDPQTFTITVDPVNDAPVVTNPASISVTEDTTTALTVISVSDVDADNGSITLTLSVPSGEGTLSANAGGGVTVAGSGSRQLMLTGSVADINAFIAAQEVGFTTAQDATDPVTLTITADDGGNSGSGGARTDTETTTLNVSAVNDAPVNSVPGARATNEDTALVFSGANVISTSDVDAGNQDVRVELSVTNGTLTLSQITGLTFTSGGNGQNSMTFTGTLTSINAALDGLRFDPNQNYSGPAQLTITTNDRGNTGSVGDKSDTDTVDIAVNPVNDDPTANDDTPTTDEDTATTINVLGNDTDPDGNGTLDPSSVSVTGGPGDGTATVDPQTGEITYTPDADFNGTDSFTYEVCDDGNPALCDEAIVTVTVTVRNDAPEITNVKYSSPAIEGSPVTITVTATDIDTPPGDLVYSFDCDNDGVYETANAPGDNTATCAFGDQGTYPVRVRVSDGDKTDEDTVQVQVGNADPAVSLTNPAPSADEGDTVTYQFTASDAGNDTLTFTVDCGAGVQVGGVTFANGGGSFQCRFPDGPANTTVSITADDGEGGTDQESAPISISNVPPDYTAPNDQTAQRGQAEDISLGVFTDPGTDGPWQITVNWGDGDTETFTVPESARLTGGGFDLGDRSHTYANNGDYTVTVTVAEDGGAPSDSGAFEVTFSTPLVKPTLDLTNASDTGGSNADDLTNDTTPTFAGTAEPDSTVEIYDVGDPNDPNDDALLCLATANVQGNYSCTVPVGNALADGEYVTETRSTDADNTSVSDRLTITVDTVVDTRITAGPAEGATITDDTPTFDFDSPTDGAATFECRLTRQGEQPGQFISCNSPEGYGPLADGMYTFEVRATDAAGNTDGTPATRTFTVDADNDPPVVDLNGADNGVDQGAPITFTEGGNPVRVDLGNDLTVSSPNGRVIAQATARIMNAPDGAVERLAADTAGTGIVASYDPNTGVLTLTGPATLAQFQQVLRTLTYENTSQNPTAGNRSIELVVNDGVLNSAPATATVRVAPVNATKADLEVRINTPEKVTKGKPFPVTFTVTNNGPDTAKNAVLKTVLPEGVRLASTPDDCRFDRDTRILTCELGDLPDGTRETLKIQLEAQDADDLGLRANIDGDSSDPKKQNNGEVEAIEVQAAPRPKPEPDPKPEPNGCREAGKGKTFFGTPGRDVMRGTPGNDTFFGFDGNDTIYGGGGEDSIVAGAGNDTIRGGGCDDSMDANSGNDTLYGEGGQDALNGNDGADTLYGGSGKDSFNGSGGSDRLYARDGAKESVNGGSERDRWEADGKDTLTNCP